MLRDDGGGRNFTRRREFARRKEHARNNHRRGTGKSRCNHGDRGLVAHGAAVGLRSLTGLRSGRAATVRCVLRPLQAGSKRRKQRTHQYDGHRRALKESALHEGSLPRKQLHCVMCIKGWPRKYARLRRAALLDVHLCSKGTSPKEGRSPACVLCERNMDIEG